MLISKYKSVLNSDIWENDVLDEDADYPNIQEDNVLEHLYFMKNGYIWFGRSGICDQLKFHPNQIKLLSLSIKQNSERLKELINSKISCGSLPDIFHIYFRDISDAAT